MTATATADSPARTDPRRASGRRLDRPALLALLLGALGVGYRIVLLAGHAPLSNSDEATMGLAALHIAQGADWPVWFYGQHYMGALEAYAAAPLVWIAGPTVVALRVVTLACYAVFLWCAYRLTRLLYSPWLAVLTVGLLALGADRVVRDQLIAGGGYPEVLPLGAGAVLLALLLGLDRLRRPLVGFAGFGLLLGLAFWDDWLIAPYALVAVAVLVVGCGRRLLGAPALLALGGAVLGALPALVFNLRHPEDNSFAVYRHLSGGLYPVPLGGRLHGGIGIGVALANGGCQPGHCGPGQVAGSWCYLALLLVALLLAVAALLGAGRRPPRPGHPRRPSGADRLLLVGRLGLALAALATVALYVRNPGAALDPLETARYLSPMQISLAATLWPLWLAARPLGAVLVRRAGDRLPTATGRAAQAAPAEPTTAAGQPQSGSTTAAGQPQLGPPTVAGQPQLGPGRRGADPARGALAVAGAAGVVLLVLAASMVWATVGAARRIPQTRADQHRLGVLTATLERLGEHDVYSEYWTCNRIVYATRERVACATINEWLYRGQDRLLEIRRRVDDAAHVAYVAPAGGPVDAALRGYFTARGVTPTVTELPGYRIYQVPGPVGVPRS